MIMKGPIKLQPDVDCTLIYEMAPAERATYY